jgi:beta-phosphoglucomutase-like phosphatase (HAD superfamily)
MDGTLIDSERLWDVSLQDTARELGSEMSAQARDSLVGVDIDTSIVVLLDDLGVPATPERIAWTYERLVARTEELFTAGDVDWRHGARAALRTVRDAGIPTALVTNSLRRITELALDGIGREFFDVTVCGDEVEEGKPAPDPYRRAAELLGVPRSGAWPSRTPRTARWPPNARAPRFSSCLRGGGADRAAAHVP